MMRLTCKQISLIMTRARHRGGSPALAVLGRLSTPMVLRCRSCGTYREETDFHKSRQRSSGRTGECKPCTKARKATLWRDSRAPTTTLVLPEADGD